MDVVFWLFTSKSAVCPSWCTWLADSMLTGRSRRWCHAEDMDVREVGLKKRRKQLLCQTGWNRKKIRKNKNTHYRSLLQSRSCFRRFAECPPVGLSLLRLRRNWMKIRWMVRWPMGTVVKPGSWYRIRWVLGLLPNWQSLRFGCWTLGSGSKGKKKEKTVSTQCKKLW